MNIYKAAWENSYARGDNNILYPQTEVIKFINRYICKRNNDKTITKIIDSKNLRRRRLRGLDFACGVGTHCITFNDFEIEGWGVDISNNAIQYAKINAKEKGFSCERFIELDAKNQKLPFQNSYFDFVVAESCLDSMPFIEAKNYISEIKRVCSGLVYASLIGADDSMDETEFEIKTPREFGTYQTVYDKEKIAQLFGAKISDFIFLTQISNIDIKSNLIKGKRFYCVIESEDING